MVLERFRESTDEEAHSLADYFKAEFLVFGPSGTCLLWTHPYRKPQIQRPMMDMCLYYR
jgi:hypothetical protein